MLRGTAFDNVVVAVEARPGGGILEETSLLDSLEGRDMSPQQMEMIELERASAKAVADLISGETRRAFVPIAGLHHAGRDTAAGFCVFNDCGIAVEALRKRHGVRRLAYVDIDAHHGDGVFYAFEDDPDLWIADLHENGNFLYPGSGDIDETGRGDAAGTKINIPLPPGAGDELFFKIWPSVERFVEQSNPEVIILQCGADSLAGDPITHLALSSKAHFHAAQSLCRLADRKCAGRMLALGGGGYNRNNLAAAWTAVVRAMLETGNDQSLVQP